MITVTENAQRALRQHVEQTDGRAGLRLVIRGDIPGTYQPELILVEQDDASPQDSLVQCGNLVIFIGPESAPKALGLNIDVLHTVYGPRLNFDFPPPKWDNPVASRLQTLIDERINPGLLSHGGYVSLLGVQEGVAEIWMGGGCQGCALSAMTLSQGIEDVIKQDIPDIHTVIDRTDHAQGANPYHRPPDWEDKSKSARRRKRRKRK
jgi:Fe/S biogenesis protein NfuA